MFIREHGTLKLQSEGAGGVHLYHEILYIDSGESELQWMGRSYKIFHPALILIPAHTPHWLTPRSPHVGGWYMEADFPPDTLPSYEVILQWNVRQSGSDRPAWSPTLRASVAAVAAAIEAYEAGELDPGTVHRLLEYDIRKILLLANAAVSTAPASPMAAEPGQLSAQAANRYLYTLLRYMERCYADNITIEDLSRKCNLTPSYVIRLFKMTFGATPIQYLQDLRLKAAISYLESTDRPIQEIAELTGFSNLHYFSRMFKMKVGENPTTWRRRKEEGKSASSDG